MHTAPTLRFWLITLAGVVVVLGLPFLFMWIDVSTTGVPSLSLIPLFFTNPLATFLVSAFATRFHGPWVVLSLVLLVAAFLVAMFAVYNDSAIVYLGIMALAAIVGVVIGWVIRPRNRQTHEPSNP